MELPHIFLSSINKNGLEGQIDEEEPGTKPKSKIIQPSFMLLRGKIRSMELSFADPIKRVEKASKIAINKTIKLVNMVDFLIQEALTPYPLKPKLATQAYSPQSSQTYF